MTMLWVFRRTAGIWFFMLKRWTTVFEISQQQAFNFRTGDPKWHGPLFRCYAC